MSAPFTDCFGDTIRVLACISEGFEPLGCGVGCLMCDWHLGILSNIGQRVDGNRFARPVQSIGNSRVNALDAHGALSDLEQQVVALMPQETYREYGVCYAQIDKIECFDRKICRCVPNPSLNPGPDCGSLGAVAPGWWPDCFRSTEIGWKSNVTCRHKHDNFSTPINVGFSNGALEQMNSVRTAGTGGHPPISIDGCTSNWLVLAVGRALSDSGCEPEGQFPNRFVDGSRLGGAALWDTAWLNWDEPHLVTPNRADNRLLAQIEARNAILKATTQRSFAGVRFDRIDNPQPANAGSVEFWSRGVNIEEPHLLEEIQAPTGGPWFSLSLINGRVVPVRLMVRIVEVEMSLVLHRVTGIVQGAIVDENEWPSVRLQITTEATPVFPGAIHEGAEFLGIERGERLTLIDYQGRQTDFPFNTTWRGGRGARVADEWEDVWDDDVFSISTEWGYSCALAKSINRVDGGRGYPIPGLPVRMDGVETSKRMYDGQARLQFLKTIEMGC